LASRRSGNRKAPPADALTDPATAWARDVVDGRVVSGDLMRRACERHLRDIVDGPCRGLHWRPERAAHALGFFPSVLSVTAGAKVGEPFHLPSYTTFVVGALFGWMRDTGRRRFRHAWLELGKGQIKSPMMAAIGLYIMGYCGIARSEVYAIAKDRNQANVLFQDAVRMCQAPIPGEEDDTLESRDEVVIRGTGEMAWMIEHPATMSKFRALAGDERVNGPRPSLVLGDEIHEWKSGGAIETWQAALAKMPGDAMIILGTNTPAADQLVGTEYSELYQRILRGEIVDDAAFALIARTDPTDDPMKDESCWPKSLPCLGLTFPIDNVRGEVNAAEHRIAKSLTVKRLYFGIPVGTSEYWIDLDAWEAVQGTVDPEKMRGRRCLLALDLSQKNDLTALGIGWRGEDGRLHATVRYWKPRDRLADAAREDGAQYVEWAASGLINAVPGRAIEYEFVAAEAQKCAAEFDVEMLVFDPAHSSEFRKACDRIGFSTWIWMPDEPGGSGLKMMIHGQGAQGMNSPKLLWMPRSLQQLEDMILTGGIVIDESPVTKWCAGNAAIQADARNNRFIVKKRSRGRIDGLTVLAMLAGAAMAEQQEPARSYLETEGLLVL
jgi:phage terminase large subunit-like protein